MKIFPFKHGGVFDDAVGLVFEEAGVEDMDHYVVEMFESITESGKLNSEADKSIATAIKAKYGSKATWHLERHLIPVPELHFESRELPQIRIEVSVYLMAQALVKTQQNSRWITLVGAIGKAETVVVPIIFIHALMEDDLSRFAILAKDANYTTWEVPGAKPVRIPNIFTDELEVVLGWQSVTSWLSLFGAQGKCIAPLVAGSLFGLSFQELAEPVSAAEQPVTTESLVSALEGLAFPAAEAKELVRRAAPRLRADRFAASVLIPPDYFLSRAQAAGCDLVSLGEQLELSHQSLLIALGEHFHDIQLVGALYEFEPPPIVGSGAELKDYKANIVVKTGPARHVKQLCALQKVPTRKSHPVIGSLVCAAIAGNAPLLWRSSRIEEAPVVFVRPLFSIAQTPYRVLLLAVPREEFSLISAQVERLEPLEIDGDCICPSQNKCRVNQACPWRNGGLL